MDEVVVRKGVRIVCPLCNTVVGEVARDIKGGEVLDENCLHIYGVKLKKGDELVCPKCGFPLGVDTDLDFFTGSFIHTEHGWMPLELPTNVLFPSVCYFLKKKGEWRKEWDKHMQKAKNFRGVEPCRTYSQYARNAEEITL